MCLQRCDGFEMLKRELASRPLYAREAELREQ
jgi:hypothetical protein